MDILFFILLLLCLLILLMSVYNIDKKVKNMESLIGEYSKQSAIKTNKLEGLLYNLKEKLDQIEKRQKNIYKDLNTTNHKLDSFSNLIDVIGGIVSKEAQVGEKREEEKEELLIASSYGIIDINDKQKNALQRFTINDRFDRKIIVGRDKIKFYDDVKIKEVYIRSGQEIRKGEKIAKISFRSNFLMIKSPFSGVILNTFSKEDKQFYIKKGEELFLIKKTNGDVIRLLSPLDGFFIANCKQGDFLNSDSIIFKACIEEKRGTTTNIA